MTPAEIRKAAKVLRREARLLKDSHTDGKRWLCIADEDFYAKDEYDDMLDLARKLEAHAKAIAGAERGRTLDQQHTGNSVE
jgi:hypothetical protein